MDEFHRQTDTGLIRLLQQSRSQDPDLWKHCLAKFYDQYMPVIYDWCRRKGLDEPDALDVSHDLMVDIGRKIKRFSIERERRFSDWLFVVTRNAVFDFIKRQRRHSTADERFLDAATESGDLVDRLIEAFDLEIKQEALLRVERETDEVNRQIIDLRFRQGLPGKEVAQRLGIQPNSLYQRVRRLRQELTAAQQQLEENGPIFFAGDNT